MIDSRHIGNMLDVFAPALCVLTLILGLVFMGSDQDTDANLRRDQRIRDVMEGFPIQLGGENQWILVEDVPIPTAQTDMLDLNAFTSRLYQRLGTYPPVKATVFIANSNDARSMAGHHPPNCYPASGWRMNGSLAGVNNFRGVDGRVLPASIYHFELGSDTGRRVWVVNGFLVPGSAPVGTLEETRKQSSRAETSKMGLTQYQIVLDGRQSRGEIVELAGEIIGSLPLELLLAAGQDEHSFSDPKDGDGS